MAELNGINISDVFGLQKPAEKLIQTVSNGIGRFYEPIHTKRMAKAKAEEIAIIGNALKDNIDLPAKYTDGSITIDMNNYEELLKRTKSRVVFQELKKQQNIDAIVNKAEDQLSNISEVTSEPVDEDWNLRFFNLAGDITSEDLQTIWGKILAEEIKAPKTFSLRTLELLHNITSTEAKLFEKYCQYVFYVSYNHGIPNIEELNEKYSITVNELLILADCGLLTYVDLAATASSDKDFWVMKNNDFGIACNTTEYYDISIPARPLTKAGTDLYNVLNINSDINYFKDLTIYLRKENPNKQINLFDLRMLKTNTVTNNQIINV